MPHPSRRDKSQLPAVVDDWLVSVATGKRLLRQSDLVADGLRY
ncbi:hypothetical protein [Thiorhodovibrio frisius]|nr:hypothetical protein [Thiorhodovibrio frisius]